MSTAEVKAAVMQAAETTNQAAETVQSVHTQADEAIAQVQTATQQTSHEKPGEALTRLQQAKVKLDEAVIEFQAANAACEEYVNTI